MYGSAYLGTITLQRGTYGKVINLQALDTSGSAVNLTGNTSVTFNARLLGSSTNIINGGSGGTCTVTGATTGLCTYTVASGDLTAEGTYYCDLVIAYAASTVKVGDLILVVTSDGSPTQNMYCSKTDVESLLQEATEYNDTTLPTAGMVNDWIIRQTQNINRVVSEDYLPHLNVLEYYDAIPYGHMQGAILLKNHPVISISKVEYWSASVWNTATQGYPDDPANQGKETYWAYVDRGLIVFASLNIDMPQGYRVTYSYGYNNVPDEIRDLCTRMAALDVLLYKASGTVSTFNVAALRIVYSGDWELGRQEKMLMTSINRDLRVLRKHFVDIG